MDNTCFLCRSVIENEMINLKDKKTVYTNIDLLEFLQSIVPNACLIEHCDKNICHVCFTLINDLDLSRKKCLELTQLLSSYLDNRQIIKTENEDNFIQSDLLCESVTIKEEIDTEEYEIHNVENETGKIDLISSESGVFDEHDSKENVLISNGCNFCQKNLNSPNDLALHIREIHHNENIAHKLLPKDNIVEPNCPQYENKIETSIDDKKKLVKKKEKNNSLKPYECEKCNKIFKTSFKLKRHEESHGDSKPYRCEICEQPYKHKAALDIHIGMHNGIHPFTCIYCNKSFTQKRSLTTHMPIHTGESLFQCDLCGRRFMHRSSLRIHLLSHSGKKNYKCEICGVAVISASHLKRHMRRHTGEKKFDCPTCEKKFAERYNLMTHMKLHEKGTNANKHICEICDLGFKRPNMLKKHKISQHQNVDFSKSNECDI